MAARKKQQKVKPAVRPKGFLTLFSEAVSFAARAHQGQLRRDGKTPYISHPFRVAFTLRHLLGVTDESALIAAVLHDIFEDTLRDFEDVEEKFGAEVAVFVALLSKDNRLPEKLRESVYLAQLKKAPVMVKLIKAADLYDNLQDSVATLPEKRAKFLAMAREWIRVCKAEKHPQLTQAAGLLESAIKNSA